MSALSPNDLYLQRIEIVEPFDDFDYVGMLPVVRNLDEHDA